MTANPVPARPGHWGTAQCAAAILLHTLAEHAAITDELHTHQRLTATTGKAEADAIRALTHDAVADGSIHDLVAQLARLALEVAPELQSRATTLRANLLMSARADTFDDDHDEC